MQALSDSGQGKPGNAVLSATKILWHPLSSNCRRV